MYSILMSSIWRKPNYENRQERGILHVSIARSAGWAKSGKPLTDIQDAKQPKGIHTTRQYDNEISTYLEALQTLQ